MKNKLLQIIYDMRHQPVIAWVTFIATALSVFLIMVVVMAQRIETIPIPPESCRPHLLVGNTIHLESLTEEGNSMSGGMSIIIARKLYENLEGVEHTSYFTYYNDDVDIKGTGSDIFTGRSRGVDVEFFRIFDHQLVAGRYFTDAEVKAALPVVIITEGVARRAFGSDNPVGSDIIVNQKIYKVVGVVKDHTSLATVASADIFMNSTEINPDGDGARFGSIGAAMLVKDGVSFQSVRDQVKARYAMLDTEVAAEGLKTVYHEAPYDIETIAAGIGGSNITPDTRGRKIMTLTIYVILFLVPAINLGGMLHSRLSRRVSEIGVRRAFGCTRSRIIVDIIAENFLVTIAGGIIGVVLGVIFASTYTGLYETMESVGRVTMPPVLDIIEPMTIVIALAVCFVLNILSASIPAWQASRLSPVNAINTNRFKP